jgi:hypothetical protein
MPVGAEDAPGTRQEAAGDGSQPRRAFTTRARGDSVGVRHSEANEQLDVWIFVEAG